MAQPAPEPPLRAPPPPRQPPTRTAPATASDTGRMRALAVPPPAPPPAPVRVDDAWAPGATEDDFAQVAAQARLGVERKAVDEAARRKKQRLITAGAIAAAVAGIIVFLIEKFYDPDARAREAAIAAEVSRMAEQQKVTDDLTLIEVDIEKAIMDNDLDLARRELARLVDRSPQHPRREFLQASIDRAAELARLAAQRTGTPEATRSADPNQGATRQRPPERTNARPASRESARERAVERATPATDRGTRAAASNARSFGAPIGESVQRSIPLDAPINSEPTLASARSNNSFGGRTVEASDAAVGSSANAPLTLAAPAAGSPPSAGSADLTPNAPAPAPASAAQVTPARVLKRVAPVPPVNAAARSGGFVVLKYTVTEAGRVTDVEVVESSPSGVFDGAAQAAVRKWTYEPRKEDGVAVASSARARVVFEPAD